MKRTFWILVVVTLSLGLTAIACSKGQTDAKAAEPAAKAAAEKKAEPEKKAEAPKAAVEKKAEPAKAEPEKKVEPAKAPEPPTGPVSVVIETSMGDIELALDPAKAPISVANFLRYVDEKFYDGTIFHRVIDGFMIQGGGFTADYQKKETHEPIKNEAANGLRNDAFTIAMARTSVVDSATAQFFINLRNNDFLNHRSPDPRGFGYAVFGKVTKGEDVVKAIGKVPTGQGGPFPKDAPQTQVLIKSIRRVPAPAGE